MDLVIFNIPLLLFYPDQIQRSLSIHTMPIQRNGLTQINIAWEGIRRSRHPQTGNLTIKTRPVVDANPIAKLVSIYLKQLQNNKCMLCHTLILIVANRIYLKASFLCF